MKRKTMQTRFSVHMPRPVAILSALALTAVGGWFIAAPAYAQESLAAKGAGAGLGALMLLVLVVLMTGAVAGFALIWRGLFPRRVEWTGEIARRMPWGSFFFGLVSAVVVLLIVMFIANAGDPGGAIALVILSAYLLLVVTFGNVTIIEWAGEIIDPSSTGIRRAVLGAGSLWLMLLIPLVGWLVLAGLGLTGVGAALVSYIPTRQTPLMQTAAAPSATPPTSQDPPVQ